MTNVERAIVLEGCYNFRDLGGYRGAEGRTVRWRRLFRSDSLHRATQADVRRLVDELGVVTVVDLRTSTERERGGPVGVESRPGVRAHHLPMIDDLFARPEGEVQRPPPDNMGDAYVTMLSLGAGQVAATLRALAEPGALPAVFYCAAGKDRTGVLTALVLGLLGVSDEDIVRDYALTDPVIGEIIARTRAELPEYGEVWDRLPPDALEAPARTMRTFLGHLRDEHGSIEAFAASIDAGAGVVDALRGGLLE